MNEKIAKAVLAWIGAYRRYAEKLAGMKVPMWVDFPDENGKFPPAPEGQEDNAWAATLEVHGKLVRVTNMTEISNPIIEWVNGVPIAPGSDAVFYTPYHFRPSPGVSLEL